MHAYLVSWSTLAGQGTEIRSLSEEPAFRVFAEQDITIERILTDNGNGYRSFAWRDLCAELGIVHARTKPYSSATNGKVERFNRTLLDEWAYAKVWKSEASRARAPAPWLHRYNHHRHHTAIDGPPASRVNKLAGSYS